MSFSISDPFTLCSDQHDACLKKSNMSLFEVLPRFELNVTVRALIKLSEAANTLEICSSDLVLRHAFPPFKFELSRRSRGDFLGMKQKMEQISETART